MKENPLEITLGGSPIPAFEGDSGFKILRSILQLLTKIFIMTPQISDNND